MVKLIFVLMIFKICKILVCNREKVNKLNNVDLNKYKQFVNEVTSEQSNSTDSLTTTLKDLETKSGVNMALLLTGSIGMASEGPRRRKGRKHPC